MNESLADGAPPVSPPLASTLVIPAYNRGSLIEDTLRSALRQTLPFAEIIVVDDGSTDDTADRVEAMRRAEKDVPLRLIRTANQGVQAARDTGILAATTELVALCDSDDLLESVFCETMAGWMGANPRIDIAYCNFATFDENRSYGDKFSESSIDYFEGAVQSGDFFTDIPDLYLRSLSYQPLFTTGIMMKKSFYRSIGGYDSRFKGVGAEDWEFTLRALTHGNVAVCASVLARIRRHAGNDSRDATYMALGEVHILEYGLDHHPGTDRIRQEIQASIDARRLGAFNAAFASGDFRIAEQLGDRLESVGHSRNFRAKRFILRLPRAARNFLWKVSQRIRPM